MKKRGVSPVVATVLLVLIVIVLAVIIFLWARGFIKERVQKFGEDAEQVCDKLDFSIDASDSSIDIINNGNFALYGLSIEKVSGGDTTRVEIIFDNGLYGGDSASQDFDSGVAEKLVVSPIILGTRGEKTQPYTCDNIKKEVVIGA